VEGAQVQEPPFELQDLFIYLLQRQWFLHMYQVSYI
jgi:hypothetical protein